MDGLISRRLMRIDELAALIGSETGVSRWFLIDQKRIDAFADITEDRQFIHVDPEAAKDSMMWSASRPSFATAVTSRKASLSTSETASPPITIGTCTSKARMASTTS